MGYYYTVRDNPLELEHLKPLKRFFEYYNYIFDAKRL